MFLYDAVLIQSQKSHTFDNSTATERDLFDCWSNFPTSLPATQSATLDRNPLHCHLGWPLTTAMHVPTKCIKKTNALSKCKLAKFRKVSDSVWVSFEAVIIEKTLKEE